jgi:hypothetical protein
MIDYALFDPSSQIIKTVVYPKSYREWMSQATHAVNMIDRMDALQALRDTPVALKRADLIARFHADGNHIIRTEIVYQLAADTTPASIALLHDALHDSHYLVRRSVVEDVDQIPAVLLTDAEQLLTDTSYITIENTLRKLSRQQPARRAIYTDRTKYTIGISKNVHIAWLELQTDSLHTIYRDELIDLTSHSFEFRTRVRAMEALERLDYFDEKLLTNLCDAIGNPNTRLANPAYSSLVKLVNTKARKSILKGYMERHTLPTAVVERLKVLG